MKAKSIALSVRISPEDAEFISKLDIADAITPSEKIRGLIARMRDIEDRKNEEYRDVLKKVNELFSPIVEKIRLAETQHETHSELLSTFSDWLIDTSSFFVNKLYQKNVNNIELDALKKFEKGLAERVFRLLELICRLGITQQAPCYNKKIIRQNMTELQELTALFYQQSNKIQGEKP